MKKISTVIIFSCMLLISLPAEDQYKEKDNQLRWGFSGSIEMGGMSILGSGLDAVNDNGYGSISRDSLIALFSAGMNFRKTDLIDLAFTFSYFGGGSFVWQDIFGDPGSDFSLFGDSLAIQVELQPLFPVLHGFHPFIGGGYSITNGLIDEMGDGFVKGRGPFIVGGLYVFNSLGLSFLPFSIDEDWFFGLRISAYYRFPYNYQFKLDWDEFSVNYMGPADIDTMRAFFENTFSAENIVIGVGISIGGVPFRFGKK